MGSRGPKKTPTKLRLMRGNPSKEAINKSEPEPPPGNITPPPEITGPLRDLWDELAAPVAAMGLLTVADISTFAKLVHIEHSLRGLFPHILTDDKAMRDYIKLATLVLRYYDRYGMNPSARSQITVGNNSKADPLGEFLKQA